MFYFQLIPPFGRPAAVSAAPVCRPVEELSSNHDSGPGWFLPKVVGFIFIAAVVLGLSPLAAFAAPKNTASVNGLSCANASLTGAASDTCTVTLGNTVNSTGGQSISLSSSNAALQVPAAVTVPQGANSASFMATASAVSAAQTATLQAHGWRTAASYNIQLNPSTSTASSPAWTIASASVAFGNVTVNTTATQSVLITSTGTSALTISSGTVTGTGFSVSGLAFPTTLNPGQTAVLNIAFAPTAAASDTGTLTLVSNAASGGTATIALSGTGQAAAYSVDLNWSAPSSSSDPVAGYKIYRSSNGGSTYQLLNSSVDSATTYTDTTVTSGASYAYYVASVDSLGNQSAPSNTWTATIP